ncbi:MAG: hypothetical protein HOE19_02875 [Candidatus Komeilibacteria bacterium]|jgi:hypothetical protein|nr:hypothetical protein [Candidatus Komeilibacteria bacterium]MBT4447250.1 hypothetical protein [Candidatus Komeilibacteria bacterium]
MKKQDGFIGIILLIIITAGLAAGGTYVVLQDQSEKQITKAVEETTSNVKTQAQVQIDKLDDKIVELEEELIEKQEKVKERPSGWRSYYNPGGMFSFSYPIDWNDKQPGLFANDEGYLKVSEEQNLNNLDAEGVKENYYANDTYGYQYEDSYLKISGVEAYKQGRYDLGIIERYYIPTKDTIYKFEFEFNFEDESVKEKHHYIIDSIINNFKFSYPGGVIPD